MRKSLLIIGICILSVIIFQAFTTSQEPHFKNLKVLPKDISGKGLDSVMHHFTAALGVKCNFCHEKRADDEHKLDFASDEKPEKRIARKMMLMSIDLNKNYFRNMEHHDHDMNNDIRKEPDHDQDANKGMDHDINKDMDHDMDTSMNLEPSRYMLRAVTCYTCHRGDSHPDSKIPAHAEGPRPPMPPMPPMPPSDNK